MIQIIFILRGSCNLQDLDRELWRHGRAINVISVTDKFFLVTVIVTVIKNVQSHLNVFKLHFLWKADSRHYMLFDQNQK